MHDKSPKISIIVPSLNQGQYIEETLLSVLQQDYPQTELIVIDGGSSDNTVDILKKYENRISYCISEKDNGQSEAINKGLRVASGEILTWLNSDDYYETDTLRRVATLFSENPDIEFLHGRARVYGKGRRERIAGPEHELQPAEYLSYMRFPQPASFFRKNVLDQTGLLNPGLHYAMDFELTAKAVLSGIKLKGIPEVLASYRLHSESKSIREDKFLVEWGKVFINILFSLKNGKRLIRELQKLGINHHVPVQYNVMFQPDDDELEAAFLNHLHLHFHTRYRMGEMEWCNRIALFLKENYPAWYRKKEYGKFINRLRFTPGFLFSLAQRMKN